MHGRTGLPNALAPPADRYTPAPLPGQELQQKWKTIAGARVAAFQFALPPGSQGLPVQFVISTTEPFENHNEVLQAVLQKARESGMLSTSTAI